MLAAEDLLLAWPAASDSEVEFKAPRGPSSPEVVPRGGPAVAGGRPRRGVGGRRCPSGGRGPGPGSRHGGRGGGAEKESDRARHGSRQDGCGRAAGTPLDLAGTLEVGSVAAAAVVCTAGGEACRCASALVRVLVVFPGDPLPPEVSAPCKRLPDRLDDREGSLGSADVRSASAQVDDGR